MVGEDTEKMMQVGMFSVPPPAIPTNRPPPPPGGGGPGGIVGGPQSFQPLSFKPFKAPDGEFDGKRLRKSVMRKTVDYNCSVVNMLEQRVWQRDERDHMVLQPDVCYASEIQPPIAYPQNPINAVVSKFVRTSTNKAKCPIFCLAWTPEGRRLVTGASSGEFTLWNGLTFNFETILQAHDSSVRTMVWSHNDQWMVTGDTGGFVKYWQTNMNNVKHFQAHKDPVRGLSFSPSDQKFATGSDDGTVRIWDFYRCYEEKVLRGHGADVKCVDWHPSKSLLASGSKDNQQPIKLWDPRSGQPLAKLHAHKSTVMDLKWNGNGNWLCSASRDHLLKLFDVRNLSTEFQVFRGHKKEASCIGWHPHHEGLFASGGSDGSILFWHVGNDKEVGAIESAHDGIIWDLAWHPLGHILCSGSNDHTSKFWTRNRPGDKMRDKYNLNTLPAGVLADDSMDIDDIPVNTSMTSGGVIPGMGPDDRVEEAISSGPETIPGLDFDSVSFDRFSKKTPYAKPIPKTFQAAWNAAGGLEEEMEDGNSATSWVVTDSAGLFSLPANIEGEPVYTDEGEELPPGSVPLESINANSILYFGFLIPLNKVSGEAIQNAFSTMEEEEAIAEITKDFEFARKLIKEKNQLLNPNANSDEQGEKKPGGFPPNQFNDQAPPPNFPNNPNPNNPNPNNPIKNPPPGMMPPNPNMMPPNPNMMPPNPNMMPPNPNMMPPNPNMMPPNPNMMPPNPNMMPPNPNMNNNNAGNPNNNNPNSNNNFPGPGGFPGGPPPNFQGGPRNFGPPRGNFRGHNDGMFGGRGGGMRGGWQPRMGPQGNMGGGGGGGGGGSRFSSNDAPPQGFDGDWNKKNSGMNNGADMDGQGGGGQGWMHGGGGGGGGGGRGRGRGGRGGGGFNDNWGRNNHWMGGRGGEEQEEHGKGSGGQDWQEEGGMWGGGGGGGGGKGGRNYGGGGKEDGGWGGNQEDFGGGAERGGGGWRGKSRGFRGRGDFQQGGRGGRGDYQRSRGRGDYQRGRGGWGGPQRGRGRGGEGGWDNYQ
ncbi:hypothetical protein Pmani_020744 [Petrolisthes manimaculis]|uniref:Pre-mRNA 3' end processing protein WDR33 n=1 Tax=Petrolisthes manimaculis TaxID=1843537 RepID=A0AAE1PI27_9EUCA|nr:hypothetical protein Pmani_020744 [Petrolisthes manimaculis]